MNRLRMSRRAFAMPLVAALLVASVESTLTAAADDAPMWSRTGDMLTARRDHASTVLLDGRVLVIGWDGEPELYDPATDSFVAVGDPTVGLGQGGRTVSLLDGTVLLVPSGTVQARVYDPATQRFRDTSPLSAMRSYHSATRLADGTVLVVGGGDFAGGAHAMTELYSPADGLFRRVGSLNTARTGHTATLLPNGRVLVAGGTEITSPGFGNCLSSAEIYDPSTGTFSFTGSMTVPRCGLWWSDAVVLASGKVLIAGGPSAEVYDPATETFAPAGSMTIQRILPSVTLLDDGRVLIAGGLGQGQVLTSAEIYEPATDTFTLTAEMSVARVQHSATRLRDGRVLVTGGVNITDGHLRSAEIFSIRAPDATPPVIEPSVTPAPNAMGWHNTDVTVSWSVSDPESGIASSAGCGSATLTTDTSGAIFTCTATNGAGLTSTMSVTVKRDTVAPQIIFDGNAGTYFVDENVDITCTASDERSGLATSADCGGTAGAAYAFGLGLHAITATAADNAGNVTDASTNFTVEVTYDSLCALTRRFVEHEGIASSLCAKLDAASNATTADARVRAIEAYGREVRALQILTPEEATVLLDMANGL